jgi:hypothetical protein
MKMVVHAAKEERRLHPYAGGLFALTHQSKQSFLSKRQFFKFYGSKWLPQERILAIPGFEVVRQEFFPNLASLAYVLLEKMIPLANRPRI